MRTVNDDLSVVTDIRNRNGEFIEQRNDRFVTYTNMLSLEIKRIITDIEDVFYDCQGGKDKDHWDSEAQQKFSKLRHKLLDTANAIDRLPKNLRYKGLSCNSVPAADFIAESFREAFGDNTIGE